MTLLLSLADSISPAPATGPANHVPPWADPSNLIIPLIIGLMIFFFFSSSRTRRTEQKQRDDMLKNLKRGDRVMTTAGIFGAVVDVRESEVVLKVDESNNIKMHFARSAIQRVIVEDEAQAKSGAGK